MSSNLAVPQMLASLLLCNTQNFVYKIITRVSSVHKLSCINVLHPTDKTETLFVSYLNSNRPKTYVGLVCRVVCAVRYMNV